MRGLLLGVPRRLDVSAPFYHDASGYLVATVDGSEIPRPTTLDVKNPVKNGINYQPQLVINSIILVQVEPMIEMKDDDSMRLTLSTRCNIAFRMTLFENEATWVPTIQLDNTGQFGDYRCNLWYQLVTGSVGIDPSEFI